MAKGKYIAWLERPNLEKLTNWAANGCTDRQLAQNIGVHHSTFYDWCAKHPAISDAIQKGREMALESVENAFFRRAMGLCEETTTVKEMEQKLVDGKLVTVHQVVKETTRRLPPDTTALIFYLKNKASYSSEPETTVNVDVAPTFVYKPEDV